MKEKINKRGFFAAIDSSDLATIKEMVMQYPGLVNLYNEQNETSLIHALKINSLFEIIKYLIEQGADIEAVDDEQDTPLILAVLIDKIEVVELLLKHSACINKQNNFGNSALICAAESGATYISQLLISHFADLNLQDNWGNTALLSAVINGHIEVAKILICNGADYNIKNKSDKDVLFFAKKQKCEELIIMLKNKSTIE